MTSIRKPRLAMLAAVLALAFVVTSAPLQGGFDPAEATVEDGTGADTGSRHPERYRFLKAQVFTAPGLGAVAVGMPNPRTIKVQRRDEATGAWGPPRLLYRKKGVTCGEIAGRASAGGVALIALCDKPYYEDQAPVHSVALVSTDLRRWEHRVLPGEAYQDPAISPEGDYAAWLSGGIGDVVLWRHEGGFSGPRSSGYDSDSGGETLTVTDDGAVSVLGPDPRGNRRCVLSAFERTVAGVRSSTEVAGVDPGCTEGLLRNVDAFTVTGTTGTSGRAGQFEISRADADSPWVLTRIAPVDAPGLESYAGRSKRVISAGFPDVSGGPLVAVGSPDRQRIYVQTYDPDAQEWGTPREVYDHGFPGCTTNGELRDRPLSVYALTFHCYPKKRADGDYPPFTDDYFPAPRNRAYALLSPDGEEWRMIPIRKRPMAVSGDRRLVSVFKHSGSTVVSPDGFANLPVTESHRCGFVVPIGPEQVLRLHGAKKARWPHRLQRLDGEKWVTIDRVRMPRGKCRTVFGDDYETPTSFFLTGSGRQKDVQVVRTREGYQVVRSRY